MPAPLHGVDALTDRPMDRWRVTADDARDETALS